MKEKSVQITGKQIELPMLIQLSQCQSHTASRVTWHSHEGFELLLLHDGATTYEFAGGATIELCGGHFLVIPPGCMHRGLHDVRSPSTICGIALKASNPALWRNTTFMAPGVRRLHTALKSANRKVHPFNPMLRWLVRRLLEEIVNYPATPHPMEAAIALRSLICAVLVEAMRQILVPPTEPKKFVTAAINYMRQHLNDEVRMNDLIRYVGFGRARMFDIFKAQTGLTPNDYLQRLRIEKAVEQLTETNLSITQIALESGFSSGQYFSTVFARYTGLSPTCFRKSHPEPKARGSHHSKSTPPKSGGVKKTKSRN